MKQYKTQFVSIITPAFNSAQFIGEAIKSVQSQTHKQWEMLVVIDTGTVDSTASIVQEYSRKDPRVRLIEIVDGRGIALSRNRALREAQGQYVAFLDSDDLWLPEKLEKQIGFMIKTGFSFSCTGYRRIDAQNARGGKLILPPSRQTYRSVLGNNLISCPTVIIDQSKTGPLQMIEFSHEDYILWLSVLKEGFDCGGLREDLARYRIVPNSRSQNVNRSGSRWQVYRQFEGLGFFQAAYFFMNYATTAILKRVRF